MPGGWVTIDKSADKKEREKDRKQRKREEAAEERYLQQVASDTLPSLVGGAVQRGAVAPSSKPSAAKKIRDEEAIAEAQRQEAAARREEARQAKRRATAEHSRAVRDPSLWPLTATVIVQSSKLLKTNTQKSLEGLQDADLSYIRALHAVSTLESVLKNTIPSDDVSVGPYRLPLASLQDDDVSKVLTGFAAQYLTFGPDGDVHTMFNLLTSIFGSRGAREDANGQGVGSRLGAQLLIQHNLRHALAVAGMIADAFTAIESTGRFHTTASTSNFLTIAHTLLFAVDKVVANRALGDDTLSLVEVRNACVSLVRALTNDKCARCGKEAAELLTSIEATLESLTDMELPSKNLKALFLPMYPQDIQLIVGFAAEGRIAATTAKTLIMELGVDHHVDVAKGAFNVILIQAEQMIANTKDEPAIVGELISVLCTITIERGADLFGSWGECFVKTPIASSRVLDAAVREGAAIDQAFLDKVKKRVTKIVSPVSAAVASSSLNRAAMKGKVSDVVSAAKKRTVDGSDVVVARRETSSNSFLSIVLKVGLVLSIVVALFLSSSSSKR